MIVTIIDVAYVIENQLDIYYLFSKPIRWNEHLI